MYFRGVVDDEDLLALEAALVLASREFNLADDDVTSRERLARSILALYRAGQSDAERLKIYAISRFRWATGDPASSVIIPEGVLLSNADDPPR